MYNTVGVGRSWKWGLNIHGPLDSSIPGFGEKIKRGFPQRMIRNEMCHNPSLKVSTSTHDNGVSVTIFHLGSRDTVNIQYIMYVAGVSGIYNGFHPTPSEVILRKVVGWGYFWNGGLGTHHVPRDARWFMYVFTKYSFSGVQWGRRRGPATLSLHTSVRLPT